MKLERIFFKGMDNLTSNTNKLKSFGRGTLKDNGYGRLKLVTHTLKIIQENYVSDGLDSADSFLKDAENFLKEHRMYVVNSKIRDRKSMKCFSKLLNQKLTGEFYKELD